MSTLIVSAPQAEIPRPGDSVMAAVMDTLRWAGGLHAAQGQTRRRGEPYVFHLIEVTSLVASVPHTFSMLFAAACHDLIEDTGVTASEIRQRYGSDVEELVVWLTNDEHPSHLNRATRKDLDRQRLARAPAPVHTIKCADGLSNCRDCHLDPAFARIYIPEKMRLIQDLNRGDSILLSRFDNLLTQQWGIIEELELQRQMSVHARFGSARPA